MSDDYSVKKYIYEGCEDNLNLNLNPVTYFSEDGSNMLVLSNMDNNRSFLFIKGLLNNKTIPIIESSKLTLSGSLFFFKSLIIGNLTSEKIWIKINIPPGGVSRLLSPSIFKSVKPLKIISVGCFDKDFSIDIIISNPFIKRESTNFIWKISDKILIQNSRVYPILNDINPGVSNNTKIPVTMCDSILSRRAGISALGKRRPSMQSSISLVSDVPPENSLKIVLEIKFLPKNLYRNSSIKVPRKKENNISDSSDDSFDKESPNKKTSSEEDEDNKYTEILLQPCGHLVNSSKKRLIRSNFVCHLCKSKIKKCLVEKHTLCCFI